MAPFLNGVRSHVLQFAPREASRERCSASTSLAFLFPGCDIHTTATPTNLLSHAAHPLTLTLVHLVLPSASLLMNSLRRMQGGDSGVPNLSALNSMGHGQDGGNAGGLPLGLLGGGGGSAYGLPMQFGGQMQYNQQALLQGMAGGAGGG